ncbi:unnamed protein product [Amoebophrya sp. A120]|nr:unnamed protein product [Amoebophrya sp. A120]|eukprot:GSA120T00008602001.1
MQPLEQQGRSGAAPAGGGGAPAPPVGMMSSQTLVYQVPATGQTAAASSTSHRVLVGVPSAATANQSYRSNNRQNDQMNMSTNPNVIMTPLSNDNPANPVNPNSSHQSMESKYAEDIDRVRRNGNLAVACAIICFFTGCCNYCANCCVAPWLAIFGHKASSVPRDLDQPQCCCICVDGKPADNVKLWSTLTFVGIFGWSISLIAAFAYAQGILVYPDHHCTYSSRAKCATCFQFNSTSQVTAAGGGWRYYDDSWNTCMAGPGGAPSQNLLADPCYHDRNNLLRETVGWIQGGPTESSYSYKCPYYPENSGTIDLVDSSKRNSLWYDVRTDNWIQQLVFGFTCHGYENSLNNPSYPLCTELCACLGGHTEQTEQSRSSESYAMFAIVLSIISTLSMIFLCAVQLDTRSTMKQMENTWPLIKNSAGGASGITPYNFRSGGTPNTLGVPVIGMPADSSMGTVYQAGSVVGGTGFTGGGGLEGQSGVATGIPVAASTASTSTGSRSTLRAGAAANVKTVEMREMETLESLPGRTAGWELETSTWHPVPVFEYRHMPGIRGNRSEDRFLPARGVRVDRRGQELRH